MGTGEDYLLTPRIRATPEGVTMPDPLAREYRSAAIKWGWIWVFPRR